MSAPLERLLEKVEETIKIIDEKQICEYDKKVTKEEITSAFKESIDKIERKERDRKGDIGLYHHLNILRGFYEGIQYMTEITRDKLYSLSRYLEIKIKMLKKDNL